MSSKKCIEYICSVHAFKLQKAFKIKKIYLKKIYSLISIPEKKTCPIVTQPQRNFGNEVKIH